MKEEKNPIQVADKLFGVLEFLAKKDSAGLLEIANSLGLNKSTTHRILRSLIYLGYVSKDENSGKYMLIREWMK